MLALAGDLTGYERGFAKMGHCDHDQICRGTRVLGRPNSPQGFVTEETVYQTPGSTMISRVQVPAGAGFAHTKTPLAGRIVRWMGLLGVMSVLCLSAARLSAESANADYKRGQNAEARQDYDTAFQDYQKAFKRNPKDLRFRTALDRVRVTDATMHLTNGRKLLQSGDTQGALTEFLHAAEIDPGIEAAQQEIAKLRQMQGVLPPPAGAAVPETGAEQAGINSISSPVQLKPLSNEPMTLHMSEDAKVIYEAVGKAAGVNVLFDPDYSSKRIQVDLSNISLMDALRIVGSMSNTFWRPITINTIFVAQDTRIKRTELDEQAVQTFYLTNAWQQNDLNDVQTALRNVLPSAKVYGVASQNAIVMRGTPDELLLAQKLINDLDKPRPEVVVDIGVLEVSKNWEKTLGMAWPTSVGVALQAPCTEGGTCSTTSSSSSSSTTTSPTLYDLSHLKATDFAVSVGSATLNLLLTDDNTQTMENPRVRATDGQKATLTIGSKIPIATGSYQTGAATALVSSLVNTQFQYIDVGVKIEITPTVHFNDDVTLKIHIEDSAESNSVTISGVTEPIISQRVADQVIRLREGEASILGGLQDNQEGVNWSGIPGLSSIPILKYLFGSKDHKITNDDIVFVVVPHVVRSPELSPQNLRAIDTGEGQNIQLRYSGEPIQVPAPTVRPAALVKPGIDTVPGQNAPAAALAAMKQMKANTPTLENPPTPAAPQPAAANPRPSLAPAPAPTAAAPQPGGLSFAFNPPAAQQASGSTFEVPITLNAATDVASIPLQLHYDPAHLTLVNVADGNLLNRDGQAAALIHRDDGPGNVTVVTSRPPGAAGVSGSGVVCVLTFTAKAPGQTALNMTRASTVNTKQIQVPGQTAQASIVVK
jgi:general secretion pathway protein D